MSDALSHKTTGTDLKWAAQGRGEWLDTTVYEQAVCQGLALI